MEAKIHYRFHRSPTLVSALNQISPSTSFQLIFLISNLILMFREIIYCMKNSKQIYTVLKQSKILVNIYYYTNNCTYSWCKIIL